MVRRRQQTTMMRRLILMRETGPKSQAWHAARKQMIWRLHRELEQTAQGDAQNYDADSTISDPGTDYRA